MRAATQAMVFGQGGCSFGDNLTVDSKASEGSRVDTVDVELERLISKRASQDRRPDPDEKEELWKASVRAHNSRKSEEMRAAWCEHHQEQAARLRGILEGLVAHHEEQAAKLMDVQPEGAA